MYHIAGYFRGVLIFVIFMANPGVTKFSTHGIFTYTLVQVCKHQRSSCFVDVRRKTRHWNAPSFLWSCVFRRLPANYGYACATKFKTTKCNSEGLFQLFTKISTHENNPLYGISQSWLCQCQRSWYYRFCFLVLCWLVCFSNTPFTLFSKGVWSLVIETIKLGCYN